MSRKVWITTVAAAVAWAAGGSQAHTAEPSERALTRAVTAFLADHGDLCVGKVDWPRDVTAEDRQAGSNDAVQLPVLERLGLVESTGIAATPVTPGTAVRTGTQGAADSSPTKRYSLTARGRQYYLQKKRTVLGPHEQLVEQNGDLCVARLSLDKVVRWTPPEQARGHLQTLVRYTYHIKSADWLADPEARRVFPIVDRIIRGQGTLLMSATVRLQDGQWVPILPGQ